MQRTHMQTVVRVTYYSRSVALDPPKVPSAGALAADGFAYYMAGITMSDGTVIRPPTDGVTAVVGGNNSGKSTFLAQLAMRARLRRGEPLPIVPPPRYELITDVEARQHGTPADLRAWLDASRQSYVQHGSKFWTSPGGPQLEEQLVSTWPADLQIGNGNWGAHLVRTFSHQILGDVQMRTAPTEPSSHPFHVLEDDPAALAKLDEAMRAIFGQQVTLDNAGMHRHLRLGVTDVPIPGLLDSKHDYFDALAELPRLSEQGEGMQRVAGMLLVLITSADPVLLIDEPEAYLHPPQARAIGEFIGTIARERGVQVFLATHDRNILTGLLQADADLAVVRLNRTNDVTTTHVLEVDELRGVWGDPVLRYSSVLDGLFHRLVVLAEGDQDCRFYEAALDALNESESGQWPRASDVLFVPNHGKQNLFKLASALRAVAVPVVASPDLDVVNNEVTLRKLVEAIGGNWSTVEPLWRKATASFRASREQVKAKTVVEALVRWLESKIEAAPDMAWDGSVADEVRQLTRSATSPWHALKDYGMLGFKGAEAQAAEEMVAALDAWGVVPVRVGVLERFAPTLGVSKGPEWLPAALSAGSHREQAALDHVRRLMIAGTTSHAALQA